MLILGQLPDMNFNKAEDFLCFLFLILSERFFAH